MWERLPFKIAERRFALILCCAMAGGCARVHAQDGRGSKPSPSTPRYVAGELVVKVKPKVGERLDAALQAHQPPTHTGLVWLDALNGRYGVTAIAPLFANQPSLEEIQRKYPVRARRAPPGATSPSLRYIYKVTMRRDADVEHAALEYGQQPDVEYAQPNYLATVQHESPSSP